MKLLLFLLLTFSLHAKEIPTIYQTFEVQEPVLLELIESPPMQRLKKLHQYGIAPMMEKYEEYSRFDHSLGVWALLRKKNCSLQEQIAGLLHDISHTVFSHFGDFFFEHGDKEKSYQDGIHLSFLEKYQIAKILEKHQINLEEMHITKERYPALEQDLPNLCADRIDYNLQGAFLHGDITHEEMMQLYNDLSFDGKDWTLTNPKLAEKLALFPLSMSLKLWSGVENYFANKWLGEIVHHLISEKELTLDHIQYGNDCELWEKITAHKHPYILERTKKIKNTKAHYKTEIHPALIIPIKFRGVDPLIKTNNGKVHLSELSKSYHQVFEETKQKATQGWRFGATTPST